MTQEEWDEERYDLPRDDMERALDLCTANSCYEIAVGLGGDGLGYCLDHLNNDQV